MKKFLATAVSVVLAASLTWTSLTIVPSHADPGSPSDPPLPASVDLTQYSVPALTQGSVYACETWSVAYTLMGWYANKNGGNSQAFAPMYLFSQTGNTSMGLPEPILLGQGVDTQDDYPQGNYDYVTQPTPAQVANAANFRFTGFATLFDDEYGTNTTKRTAIETALASGTPVVFGILDRDGIKYYHPTSLDIADTDYGSPYPDGGHSVVAMGYDSNGVLIQNSWGHTWGVNGFGRVSWDVVEHDVSDAYVATGFSMAPTTPALTVTAPVTSVSSRHTAIPLQITSNTEWQVVSEPSWTNVNPSSGFGTLAASDDQGTVDISVLQNDSSDPRTGTVTFTTTKGSPAAVANVTITQAGATSTPVDTPTLTLGQASWNAGQGSASSVSVAVTSNTSWNVSTSDPWLYTAVQSGVGNDSVQIFASVNMTDSDRQGTVTFTSGSITRTVAVIQPMMPTLTISQSAGGTFRVPASSVWFAPSAAVWSASVPLFSNTSWTAYSDSPWLTTTPPAGSSRGSLNMSASENTSPGARTATVTVTTTSGAPQLTRTIKVIQPGTAQTATLALPMTTWWVPTAAATQATTNVTSNADWTVASSASWLTATPDPTDGTVAMATQANTSTASRTATLTFTSTTGSPAATATMTVTQPGVTSPLLTLDRDTWAPPSPQDQTVDMAVTSNQSWKVESSDSWLTPSSTVGSGSQSVMLTAHANLFRTPRTATLTFTTTLGTPILTQTVTVTQPAAQVDPQLSTDTDTWAVPSADAATTTLNVSSTGSWMAIPSDHSWLSLTSPNGAGSKPVTVSAQPNTSTTPRTATITFSSTGESPAATQVVTVTQPGIPNTLSIDQTSLQRPAITYAPATVNVDTNTTWSVTSDSSWLSVSRSSLSSIQVAVTGNYLLDRTGTITVSTIVGSPTLTRTITVTQAGNGLTLDQRGWEAPAAADSITLHVTSKANWSVSSNSSWLTVSPTSGSGNGIVTVSVAANLSAASGNLGYLTFVTSGDPAATLNFPVLQDRTDPVLTVGSDSWPVPSNTANSTTIPVTSNLGWTATSSDTSWLTVSPYGLTYNNGSLYLLAQANPSASPRTATITVSSATKSGYPPATATITVTQPGAVPASTLSVSNDKWPVPSANSASTTINVSSNTTWTTKSSDTWLTVTPANGSNNGSVSLSATTNTSTSTRNATVTLTSTDGKATATITVTQPGAVPASTLSVSNDKWPVPSANSASTTINVSSNTTWTTKSSDTWLTVTPANGSNNGSVSLSATTNTSTSTRSATVTLTSTDGKATATITVTQPGAVPASTLSVAPRTWPVPSAAGNSSTVTVYSNTAWSAKSSDTTWLTITPPAGSGNGPLTLWAQTNTSTSTRSATVTLTSTDGKATATLTVTQPGAVPASTLSVSNDKWPVPSANSASTTINVSSNTTWTTKSSDTWLTVTPANGSNNGSVSLSATTNTSTSTRNATVTLTSTDEKATATITVTQPGAAPSPSIALSTPTWQIASSSAASTSVTVTANTTWTAQISDSTWLTGDVYNTSGNGSITLHAKDNTSTAARTTTVTLFTTTGSPTAYQTLTVTQPGAVSASTLSVAPSTWPVPSAAGNSSTVTVYSNTAWSAKSSDTTWLTITPPAGSGNGPLTLWAQTNTSTATRTSSVTITTTDGTATATISVTQPGAAPSPSIALSTPTWQIASSSAASTSVTVTANTTWTAQISDSTWLTGDVYNTSGNGSITLHAKDNTSTAARTTTVTLFTTTGSPTAYQTLTVTQPGANPTVSVGMPAWPIATASAASLTTTVSSNTNWSASSNQTWLKVSPNNSSGNGPLTMTADANTSTTTRSATITVSVSGTSQTITVTQPGAVSASTLAVGPTTWTLTSAGGNSSTVTVYSNTTWSAKSSDATWLTTTPSSGSNNGPLTLWVQPNTSTATRTGSVTITTTDGTATATVTVTQPGATQPSTLAVSADKWPVPSASANSIGVVVYSNTTWTTRSSDTWLTVTPTSAANNVMISLAVTTNTSTSPRSGSVTLTTLDGKVTATITVSQPGTTTSLDLSMTGVEAPSWKASSFTVAVTSTTTWKTSTNAWVAEGQTTPWLSVSPASGDGNGTLVVTMLDNPSIYGRIATVWVTAPDGSLEKFWVLQPGTS